jgi:hypothetical protein
MSATCPACGVAVLPGYAKCPKCHKPMPFGGGRRLQTVAGGTVAEDKRFPIALVALPIGAVIVIVVLLKVVFGGGGDDAKPTLTPDPTTTQLQTQNPPTTAQTVEPNFRTTEPARPQGPDPSAAAAELDRVLRIRRFWSTIEVFPPRVDVRSGSCDDPAMSPTIDGVAPTLRGAGLTQLRCLAQSGTVVFERNL